MSGSGSHPLMRAFTDELGRCGLRHACTSPGSRCAPIVLALVREPSISCFSHIDERCAGFFALGAAKASNRPVAITCTSGTAAANLVPAVIEAAHARVPLIVLSADRPPELREVGAGQAIDQLKLYGDAAKWFFEVGIDEASADATRFMRSLACRAYWTALDNPAGPVHLNFPLREPLIPEEPLADSPVPGRPGGRPWVQARRGAPSSHPGSGPVDRRAVLVAGAGSPPDVAALAAERQLPLLADPLSAARRGGAAIAHYDLLLRSRPFVDAHPPGQVIRIGDLPTSRPLRAWLAALDCEQVAVDTRGSWHDPASVVSERIGGLSFDENPGSPDEEWLGSWRGADVAVARALDYAIGDRLSEPLVAARLTQWLPAESTLFAASSMPIRDLETFAGSREVAPRILSNRGANGIDGTISAAFGAAAASDAPTVLLTGDVAFVHDLGGLISQRRLGLCPTIVALNNDGGGIFHFLPVVGERDAFEEHVATPHGLDFATAAELFGCRYEQPGSELELRAAVERGLESGVTSIVEVKTDRVQNLRLHRRLEQVAMDALAGQAGAADDHTP